MEELIARHRKEQKDLQSQITQKKKSASKKSRKGVNDECGRSELELKTRHEQEILALSSAGTGAGAGADTEISADQGVEDDDENGAGVDHEHNSSDSIAGLDDKPPAQSLQDLSISNPQHHDQNTSTPAGDANGHASVPPHRKPNRQKARLARRAAEQEAIAASAASEAANLPDRKQLEREHMLDEFAKRGLVEKEVPANGHCMYSAMADQMRQLGLELDGGSGGGSSGEVSNGPAVPLATSDGIRGGDYRVVRYAAAAYIARHPEDFAPFLDEPMDEYLRKVRDTGEWGGQLELLALAKAYAVDIKVLQGEGRLETIGTGGGEARGEARGEAWLAYYRHGFGLGEHYNSLRKNVANGENG